jgi:hypothetical protein
MEFYNFQVFTGPDEVPSAYLSEEEKASCLPMNPENSNIAQCQGAQSEDLAEWTQLLFYATLISKSLGYSSAPSGSRLQITVRLRSNSAPDRKLRPI